MSKALNYKGTYMLISAQQLSEKIRDRSSHANLKIFDCRFNLMDVNAGADAYATGHIPMSQYADLNEDMAAEVTQFTGRHPLPDQSRWAKTLQLWGVDENSECVVYDDMAGAMASRLWWMLSKWNKLNNVYMLDGGVQAWRQIDGAMQQEIVEFKQSSFQPIFDNTQVVNANSVEAGIKSNTINLIDARSLSRFKGQEEPIDAVAGHVPGAQNFSFDGNLQDGRLKDKTALKQHFSPLLESSKPIVSMCGSGVTACHNIFSLDQIGIKSKLYVGSWSEWISDASREVATL